MGVVEDGDCGRQLEDRVEVERPQWIRTKTWQRDTMMHSKIKRQMYIHEFIEDLVQNQEAEAAFREQIAAQKRRQQQGAQVRQNIEKYNNKTFFENC